MMVSLIQEYTSLIKACGKTNNMHIALRVKNVPNHLYWIYWEEILGMFVMQWMYLEFLTHFFNLFLTIDSWHQISWYKLSLLWMNQLFHDMVQKRVEIDVVQYQSICIQIKSLPPHYFDIVFPVRLLAMHFLEPAPVVDGRVSNHLNRTSCILYQSLC